jgi:short-subunit dehydrogenase
VTGASSGIGAAIAGQLARPGMRLVLGGRDAGRLGAVADTCRKKGAEVTSTAIDVTDVAAMEQWVRAADANAPLDLVIANAGISGERGLPGDDPDFARRIYAINVLGTINTVEPVLPAMRLRGRGSVCLVASLAGFVGMPRGPAYSGSKAALIVQGEGWRRALAPHGVNVTVACPGYVRTPMTARHTFKMPFLVDAEDAARIILDGTAARKDRILLPWQMRLGVWLHALLPSAVTGAFLPGTADDV